MYAASSTACLKRSEKIQISCQVPYSPDMPDMPDNMVSYSLRREKYVQFDSQRLVRLAVPQHANAVRVS